MDVFPVPQVTLVQWAIASLSCFQILPVGVVSQEPDLRALLPTLRRVPSNPDIAGEDSQFTFLGPIYVFCFPQ